MNIKIKTLVENWFKSIDRSMPWEQKFLVDLQKIIEESPFEPIVYVAPDQDLMLEWIREDCRIGMYFDPIDHDKYDYAKDDFGWFFVSKDGIKQGEMSSGNLDDFDKELFLKLNIGYT